MAACRLWRAGHHGFSAQASIFFSMWRGPLFKLLPPSWRFPEKEEAVALHLFRHFCLKKREKEKGKRPWVLRKLCLFLWHTLLLFITLIFNGPMSANCPYIWIKFMFSKMKQIQFKKKKYMYLLLLLHEKEYLHLNVYTGGALYKVWFEVSSSTSVPQ